MSGSRLQFEARNLNLDKKANELTDIIEYNGAYYNRASC